MESFQKDEIFEVVLPGNPTTGYSWVLDYKSDGVETIKDEYITDSDRIGSPGNFIFTFQGKTKGRKYLTFIYKRPWEKDHVEEKTYSFTIL